MSLACQDDFAPPSEPHSDVVKGNGGQPLGFEVYSQNMYLGGEGALFSMDFSNISVVRG